MITSQDQPIGLLWVAIHPNGFQVQTHNFVGDRSWWGKGVIHEARAALIDSLFVSGAGKIIGLPRATNRAAVQTYRDQGFHEEGHLRLHYNDFGGGRSDAKYFGLMKDEWDYDAARQLPEKVRRRLGGKQA